MRTQYRKVDEYGTKSYYLDKEMTILHREGGPAIELKDGTKFWFINGKVHREDGPAIELNTGSEIWCINGYSVK